MTTSESQLKATRAYRQRNKGKQKAVNIVMPADELERDKARIKAAGFTTLPSFWRYAVDTLPPYDGEVETEESN